MSYSPHRLPSWSDFDSFSVEGVSLTASLISFSASLTPSLKLLTPFPRPFISSGIFFPPNIRSITRAMMMISPAPRLNMRRLCMIMVKF